jgi:hypothetical protein
MTTAALAISTPTLDVGNLNAQAYILVRADASDVSLSVSPLQDPQFSIVSLGIATSVDPIASLNAGKLEIRGAQRAETAIDFTLPAALTVGPWSMPISFGADSACDRNRDQQNGCRYFDPSTTLVTRIRSQDSPNNLSMVWIGGTVAPTAAQNPGCITMTVSFTGS